MAEKKDKLVEEYMNAPIKVGDWLTVLEKDIEKNPRNEDNKVTLEVVEVISDDKVKCECLSGGNRHKSLIIVPISICKKNPFNIGSYPFPKGDDWYRMMETANYSLEGILNKCGITAYNERPLSEYEIGGMIVPEINWNPYVFNKDGEKEYYQRDFCWTLKDEQLFIESIYQHINCGLVIIRKRSWKWLENQIASGNKEVAFNDIVDGKQRMHTLGRFVNNEFKDLHGNYYSDLSERAQWKFLDSQSLQFASFRENATDDMIVKAFLNVNFTGVPMSQEHIDYVREIQKKM